MSFEGRSASGAKNREGKGGGGTTTKSEKKRVKGMKRFGRGDKNKRRGGGGRERRRDTEMKLEREKRGKIGEGGRRDRRSWKRGCDLQRRSSKKGGGGGGGGGGRGGIEVATRGCRVGGVRGAKKRVHTRPKQTHTHTHTTLNPYTLFPKHTTHTHSHTTQKKVDMQLTGYTERGERENVEKGVG